MDVVWLERRAEDVPENDRWLSARESERCRTLRVSKRRSDWRMGRWTAKQALASYLELPCDFASLAEIEIVALENGAPRTLVQGEPAPLTISLTHSNGKAACAITAGQVALGCDLERIEPRSDGFLADYFTDDEREFIARSAAADRDLLLTILWSAKESSLKAMQEGLRADTRSVCVRRIDVPQICSAWSPLVARAITGQIFDGWWRADGKFVYTIVSSPAPRLPIELTVQQSLAVAIHA